MLMCDTKRKKKKVRDLENQKRWVQWPGNPLEKNQLSKGLKMVKDRVTWTSEEDCSRRGQVRDCETGTHLHIKGTAKSEWLSG